MNRYWRVALYIFFLGSVLFFFLKNKWKKLMGRIVYLFTGLIFFVFATLYGSVHNIKDHKDVNYLKKPGISVGYKL